MVADQFDGVNLALDVALGGSHHGAVLRPDAEDRLGDLAADRHSNAGAGGLERGCFETAVHHVHRRRTDELGNEEVGWIVIDFGRRIELLEDALFEDGHAVGERHRLDLVVGHVDRRGAEARLHVLQFGAHVAAELGIEVRQRLVHEEHRGPPHHGAGQGHALALAAGKLARITVEQHVDLHLGRGVHHRRVAFGYRDFADLQRIADILGHGLVRVKRVGLEHHRHVAVFRQDVGHLAVADEDAAGACGFKPGNNAQGSGLAGTRGSQQYQEFARRDGERQLLQNAHRAK